MSQTEIEDFIEKITILYPKFEMSQDTIKLWSSIICQYDSKEVNEMFEFYASKETYRETPPQIYLIVKGLTKIADKVDFSKTLHFCSFCRKAFNSLEECHTHEDRCRSIKYIENQYKRFNLDEIDNKKKSELYNLNEEEFNLKYHKLLRWIQNHTTDEFEKRLIENVFSLPGQEEARRFLNGGASL